MTYAVATLADMRDSFEFTAFADVSDAHVQQALDQAKAYVSDAWLFEADYQRGQMLYAAHLMTLAGLGTGGAAELSKAGLDGFASVRSGGLSVSMDRSATQQTALQSTRYGRLYMELGARNVAGPSVAAP